MDWNCKPEQQTNFSLPLKAGVCTALYHRQCLESGFPVSEGKGKQIRQRLKQDSLFYHTYFPLVWLYQFPSVCPTEPEIVCRSQGLPVSVCARYFPRLSVYLSICAKVSAGVNLRLSPASVCLFVYLCSVSVSTCHASLCLSVCLSVCLHVCAHLSLIFSFFLCECNDCIPSVSLYFFIYSVMSFFMHDVLIDTLIDMTV